jgi:hypothetical protein
MRAKPYRLTECHRHRGAFDALFLADRVAIRGGALEFRLDTPANVDGGSETAAEAAPGASDRGRTKPYTKSLKG